MKEENNTGGAAMHNGGAAMHSGGASMHNGGASMHNGGASVHSGGASIPDVRIQWHPAFCAATELGLMENREELDFRQEYNLSRKPLQIDLLVVEKRNDVCTENEIGRIFRRYNIMEYKSPGDALSIDDFFKTVGYACIYKGLGETVNEIPADQLTVSLFREGRPAELFRKLRRHGLTVERKFAGIYYVEGFFFPVQIVVTKELEGGNNSSLKVLSHNAREEDVREFVERAQRLTAQGDRANADAVLQASVSANYELYNEMRRRNSVMCEAMRRLMKDEIEDALSEGMKKGRQKGIEEGRQNGIEEGREKGFLEALFGLVKDNILSVTDAAKRANMNVQDFEKAYKTFCL